MGVYHGPNRMHGAPGDLIAYCDSEYITHFSRPICHSWFMHHAFWGVLSRGANMLFLGIEILWCSFVKCLDFEGIFSNFLDEIYTHTPTDGSPETINDMREKTLGEVRTPAVLCQAASRNWFWLIKNVPLTDWLIRPQKSVIQIILMLLFASTNKVSCIARLHLQRLRHLGPRSYQNTVAPLSNVDTALWCCMSVKNSSSGYGSLPKCNRFFLFQNFKKFAKIRPLLFVYCC